MCTFACGGSSSSDGGQQSNPTQTDGGADATTDAGAVDAAPDVDNGAPSTNYPAPHPALPQLTNKAGGPVLTAPKIYLVFYPGYPYEADLQGFAQKLAASTYWGTVTSEYGVGALSYVKTIELTGETPPQTIADTDIQSAMGAWIQSGKFGTPDPQAIYTIVYPQGTTITQTNPLSNLLGPIKSCVAFGGYHDNVPVSIADGGAPTNFAYAVIPTCSASVDSLTAVLSHEWVEASTDPFLTSNGTFSVNGGPSAAFFTADQDHLIWAILGGGEAGDLCEPEGPSIYVTPQDVGRRVQRTWSNLAAKASHDPCVPALANAAFFAAAPVLDDTVTFTSQLTGTVTTKGIVIPVGQSKTTEVDLFSDAATSGPFSVTVDDVLFKVYGQYGLAKTLDFSWDRTQGLNGEKLHLTIKVTASSILGGGHAFMITASSGSRQFVWPGLVVEK